MDEKELCKVCSEEEVYGSGILTNGMCLNCFQKLRLDSEEDFYATQHED